MATYAIKWLKDKLGTRFFPITHLKAVRDDNNTNLESILSDKQDELVSGVNIKTINGNSILGSGNMDVSGGGGGGQANVIESISVNGTGQAVDANKNVNLQFKTVNNNNISGTGNINIAVPTKVSDLTNDAGYITGYTETDPVFSASVAAEITSSDITNWNGKTSNIGTITSVKMNGTTVSSSGEADLGTVITSHQDISGKADKSATVSTVTYNTTSKKITKTINGTTTDVVTAATIVTDGGGITSETDPTVPSWAKASSKPSYTASEVGAVPTTRTVNGKALSADITLSASDVSALPSSTAIPSKTSDLTNDSGYLTSADISGVYKYKGSKTNYSNLPTSGNVTGDVWNVVNAYSTYPAGTNFAWDGSAWDALGGSVDLSGYVPTSRTINGKALSSNITLSASDVSALPSSTVIPDELSDLSDDSTHRLVTDTEKSTWNSKGTYSKPSGGIPKTDLASAVQTSLGLADTALQSYTETDPVFAASAAHGITSSDISNWNSKTSNIGTITGINMNGASKGTSGVVDLGTVITAHQDISGKADKATTLSGYGITDAYTKTEVGDRYYAIWGATVINASSTNTIDLNDLTASGNYNCTTGNSQYVLNKPVSDNKAFRIVVMASSNSDTAYERQRFQIYNEKDVYERYSSGTVGSWSNWVKVQGDMDDIVSSTITTSGAASFGSTLNVTGKATMGAGLNITGSTDAYSQGIRLHDAGDLTSIWMRCANATGNDAGMVGITADSTGLRFRLGSSNTATSYSDYMNIAYGGNVGIGNTSPSYKLDVSGTLNATGAATLGSTLNVTGNTTFNGHLYFANNKAIHWKDSGGTNREILGVSSGNNLNIGYSASAGSLNTYLYGGTRLVLRVGGTSATYNAMYITSERKIGIGNTAPDELLHVTGNVKCTSVIQTSDERAKNKIDDISICVEDIANAPNHVFKWKDERDKELHGGTYAQYWEKITPYYVHGDKEKSLEYGSLALSCSIELAKEVVALKEENAQLKKELAEIKEMINKLNK